MRESRYYKPHPAANRRDLWAQPVEYIAGCESWQPHKNPPAWDAFMQHIMLEGKAKNCCNAVTMRFCDVGKKYFQDMNKKA